MLSVILTTTLSATVPQSAPPPTLPPTSPQGRTGGFVDLGWRAYGLGGHLSHGPAFAAGAIVGTYFEIGIAGFARPGPINPRTFRVDLPEGETYRGKQTLQLRSDGSAIGLHLGFRMPLRAAPIELEVPVMLGYGGFGFYLFGDDRDTPDGRRVSDWEDELLDGRDADANNFVIDAGVRIAWRPARTRFMQPYVGAHYTAVLGYDTAVLTNYSGFSGSLGIRFGLFPRR